MSWLRFEAIFLGFQKDNHSCGARTSILPYDMIFIKPKEDRQNDGKFGCDPAKEEN